MKKVLYIIWLLLLLAPLSNAQEVLSGLQSNPLITDYLQNENDLRLRMKSGEESILLPFFDDFKATSIYPSPTRWIDLDAFINTSYDDRSVNRGVATLDALDDRGNLHDNASQFPFISDYLTSQKIRLDSVFTPFPKAISRSDSIYFSFFYQPQGLGNPPESFDSLVLEFGYNTGELVFAGYYDSTDIPANIYISPGDTIRPGDTVFSPYDVCDSGLYIVANRIYTFEDVITLPCDSVFEPEIGWEWVWSTEGMSLDSFYSQYGTYSRQVILPITDSSKFYRPDFQFRFYNYASISDDFNPSWKGNSDHWNIDYIYLNINRTAGDTVYRDVSFANRAPSFLRKYQSMPYKQYIKDPTAEVVDSIEIDITNLDTATFNTRYFFHITHESGLYPFTYDGEFCNLKPYTEAGYQNCVDCDQHACPKFNYLFPLDFGDSALFRIDHVIQGDFTPVDTIGDTITYYQKFYNYFAYDDGSPEFGYGLKDAGAQLAYKFSLNEKDTLRAVQMYFNRVLGNINQKFFTLRIWGDANGKPGNVIYEENVRVEYSNSLIHLYTYFLENPILVNGIFYVGWLQQTGDNLQLGFDRNSNAQQAIFFNVDGIWRPSAFQGALLIRPMLGEKFEIIGIDENPETENNLLEIYPNPLNGQVLHVKLPDRVSREADAEITIFSLLGKQVYRNGYTHSIVLEQKLEPGMYIVSLTDKEKGIRYSSKLIIPH